MNLDGGKMNNIILDTNAFVYLIDYELGIKDNITIEKNVVDPKKLHEACTTAHSLYITSQTLYELFWQSMELGNVEIFAIQYDQIAKIRKKYGIGFSVLNSRDCVFDMSRFARCYKSRSLDENEWVEKKRLYEKEVLSHIIAAVYGLPLATILTNLPINFHQDFFKSLTEFIEKELDGFSSRYYDLSAATRPTNKDYDALINTILLTAWEATFELINEVLKQNGFDTIYIPDKSATSSADYITTLLKKNKQRGFSDLDEVLNNDLDNYMLGLKSRYNLNDVSVLFMRRLILRCAKEKVKLRKNDGLDYTIVSCLDVKEIKNETGIDFDKENTFLLTFDNNLYQYIKETNLMYNNAFYDGLL